MAKILIVDDSPTERHVLTSMLEKAGHLVVTANDGEQGIALTKTELPDLILMDVVMPGLNGFQATRKISRESTTAHIPVVMVTTKDQETDREWGMRQGAKAYLVKPVTSADLLQQVDALLN